MEANDTPNLTMAPRVNSFPVPPDPLPSDPSFLKPIPPFNAEDPAKEDALPPSGPISNPDDEVVIVPLAGERRDDFSDAGYRSDDTTSSINSALTSYPNRRRKYVRQYEFYLGSLERRVTRLEGGAPAGGPLPIPPHMEYEPAIPELNFMNWEEYLKNKGKAIPKGHYAIDVLTDEPVLYHQRQRGKRGQDGATAAMATDAGARKSEGLPSRIRINSEMIRDALYNASKRKFLRGELGFPRILLRPYKILYLYEAEIREALVELEAEVEAAQKKEAEEKAAEEEKKAKEEAEAKNNIGSEKKDEKPAADEVKEADDVGDAKPTAGNVSGQTQEAKDGDAAKENEKPAPDAQDPKDPDVNEVRKSSSKEDNKPKKPVKTLEERLHSQEAVDDLRCLIKFMDEYLQPLQLEFDQMKRHTVSFQELWHLFRPGKLVYVTERNVPQRLWRITQVTGGRPYLSPFIPAPPIHPPPTDINGIPLPPPPIQPGIQPQKAPVFTPGYSEFSPLTIDGNYIDFNGTRFGAVFRSFHIEAFEGKQDIFSLNVVPYDYAVKHHLVDEEMIKARGEAFIKCTEPTHRYYSGQTVTRTPTGSQYMSAPDPLAFYGNGVPVSEETIDSEVMVDFDRTFLQLPGWQPRLGEDVAFQNMDIRETRDADLDMNAEGIDYDYEWDRQTRNDVMAETNHRSQRYFKKTEVPNGLDLLLLPSRIFGFILRSRKWAALDIEKLRPIKPRTHGFDDLELPEGHKPVVQALVQTHFRRLAKKSDPSYSGDPDEDEEQFDLVRDKGKGLIILLHGAPGVGKTSTAECVAEANNKPLLPITCGDLGITAQDVERTLETNFRLAQAWGCVLLLDEADVFLAQRSSSDLRRNAVVSVFLRVLEYYEGILFLTTNRVGAFDEAFVSRVHLSLYYPWLNEIQTTKIWGMQMRRARERVKKLVADESAILAYAGLHFKEQCRITGGTGWNGRQIRNAFQSAIALAQFEARDGESVKLEIRHFEVVAKAAAEFDDYLIRTTGFSNAERAAQNLLRADGFAPRAGNAMSWESMNMSRGGGGSGSGWGGGVLGGGAAGGSFGAPMGGMGGMGMQSSFGGQGGGLGGGMGMPSQQQQGFGMGMGMGQPQGMGGGFQGQGQGFGTGFQGSYMQQPQQPQQQGMWGMGVQQQPNPQQGMGLGSGQMPGMQSQGSSFSTTGAGGAQDTSASSAGLQAQTQMQNPAQGQAQAGMPQQTQQPQQQQQGGFQQQPQGQVQGQGPSQMGGGFGYPQQQGQGGFGR